MAIGEVVVRWMVAGGVVATLLGCATAGDEPIDAKLPSADGPVMTSYDARPIPDAAPGTPDARVPPDAYRPPDAYQPPDANLPPDAAAGGLCDGNEDCIASECCAVIFCVPGIRVGAACIPD